MPSLSNQSRLSRQLSRILAPTSLSPSESHELISCLIQACHQLPHGLTRNLRSRFSSLFCPFCGELHSLEICPAPGASDYRLDPQAWMNSHIPKGLHSQLAQVKVKRPRKSKAAAPKPNQPQ